MSHDYHHPRKIVLRLRAHTMTTHDYFSIPLFVVATIKVPNGILSIDRGESLHLPLPSGVVVRINTITCSSMSRKVLTNASDREWE